MVKRLAQVSLAVFLVLALATMATAAPNVASTSNKGSLLVFPLVMATDDVETYFFIANDDVKPIMVKCYWMDDNQDIEDFHFELTMNQPVSFSTTDGIGPPFARAGAEALGSLVCWAQDDADVAPRKHNHLYGTAMLSSADFDVMYNASAFRAGPGTLTAGLLQLNGGNPAVATTWEYDSCPNYLVANFVPRDGDFGYDGLKTSYPAMALWPCNQDLKQDRVGTVAKAKIDIWNYYEVKYTGAYQCLKCFYEGYLYGAPGKKTDWPQSFGKEKFDVDILADSGIARMRVQAANPALCKYPSSKGIDVAPFTPGFLGVMLYGADEADDPIIPMAGHTMVGAGAYYFGWVKYDTGGAVEEAGGR